MCGLVGIYSSNMLMRHKNAMAELLFFDTLRGKDSTGLAAIRSNYDTMTLKSTVPGYEFVENPKFESHLKLNDWCWIGHNRWKTVGGATKSNAHPFEVLDDDGSCLLVGAHNGTLKNKHVFKDHQLFGTDSEALYNEIADTSLEEALLKTEGAWALSYYDHVEEELRFVRNKERTLFYAFEKDKKTLLWASEAWMLRVVCARNNIEVLDGTIHSFTEDTLYSFKGFSKTNEEIEYTRKEGLVGKAPAFFQRWTGSGTSWMGGGPQQKTETTTQETRKTTQADLLTARQVELLASKSGTQEAGNGKNQTPPKNDQSEKQSKSNSDNVVPLNAGIGKIYYKGYLGILLNKQELEKQLAGGCAFCNSEFIHITDRYGWLGTNSPICSKCLDGGHDVIDKPKQKVSVH